MSTSVLLVGGRSEIGLAVVAELRREGDVALTLAVREPSALSPSEIEGVSDVVRFDASQLAEHPATVAGWFRGRTFDVVILAFGILGDQARAELDVVHTVDILTVDFVAQASVLTVVANALRAQGSGTVVVFSSIAGARTRRANYVYGSAKAGLDGYATGLAAALRGSGAGLLVVRPGFVVGRMTKGMNPAPWSSTPSQVARATVRALRSGKTTVWVPGTLRYVAGLMRLTPERMWRRLPR